MRFAALTILLLTAGAAQAQGADTAALIACAVKPDAAERLACYDAAVAGISAEAREISRKREAIAAKAAAEQAARAEQERLAAFGRESMKDRPPGADEDLPSMTTSIGETLTTRDGKTVFLMENGQMWRQTEGMPLPPVHQGMEATIKKGVIGGFRMTIPKIKRTISVVRMR